MCDRPSRYFANVFSNPVPNHSPAALFPWSRPMLKKPHKLRVVLLGGFFCVLASTVLTRLYVLQVVRNDYYSGRADRQQTIRLTLQAERGDILDRRLRPLATSTGTLSIYINPKFFHAPESDVDLDALANQISYYTGLSPQHVRDRFERGAVTDIGRQLNPDAAQKVGDLLDEYEISRQGFWFHRESKRQYPRGLAPHIIGFCGSDGDGDNEGLAGLEFLYNNELKGEKLEAETVRTGISQVMQPVAQKDLLAARGDTLVLTIDAAIQEAAENALASAGEEFNADACGAIVQDVNTGAILALASWPTFDNSKYGASPAASRRNRLLTDPLETGSVAKLFTAAFLLDSGKIQINTLVDCEGGRTVIGRRRITDAPGHYLDVVPFYEVIRYSSNVGTIKAAQALENDEWYAYLRSFGLGQKSGVDLPGEGSGILYPVEKWTSYSRTSLPMGYEMALTSMQIVNAISGMVNGGELLEPYVIAEIRDSHGNVTWQHERTVKNRMIRPATSLLMREIMEDVVANGTGTKAQIPGFRVGGKTGTTVKSQVLTHKEYIASFGGVVPINDPKIAIYCFVDNPHGKHYASEVAAPVFQKIGREAVLQLGLVPTEVENQVTAFDARMTAPLPLNPAMTDIDQLAERQTMPDLRGLTMAEVRTWLHADLANVRFTGSGRLADQSPLPGEVIEPTTEITLIFDQEAARPVVQPSERDIAQLQGRAHE